ncbi:anthranilate synthase component I family protein [Flagellimonas lutaonensis]|uniref:Aminobenzoate synthetase n=1 Tax=Flagellimonas lutaonensis TaxID=516051 RepID=A0A0D5YXA0_9FLAO|nr:anthranilate synthase component I family protein [Allomuricauda lutaonensis]AKA36483.1 aminobenzoate synthetase [Allomuricauda lutaonensis]
MRIRRSFQVKNVEKFKAHLLGWAQQYNKVVWFDSNGHTDSYSSFEALLAVGTDDDFLLQSLDSLEHRLHADGGKADWLVGYISYDVKNELEALQSNNHDGLEFAPLHFFCPRKIIRITNDEVEFLYPQNLEREVQNDFETISGYGATSTNGKASTNVKVRLRIHKDAYFEKVRALLAYIHRGDIYEANFCQEFFSEDTEIAPLPTYLQLNAISRPPFASYLRLGDQYLLCASPERYLKKTGDTIISQPIKGTAPRSDDPIIDEILKKSLLNDPKERAENIMITDLVRNDLSKRALKGSVEVSELCQVYAYRQVHQLVSTISCRVGQGVNPVDIIKDTFPMGSMTGTPKISAMKIIEELEETKRGLYSGAVGYFTPEGDFDFNVVIRSILYNHQKKYISYSVGSAITAKSNPEKEYQECLVKAKAMRSVLEG